jgi:hypothetical protein
VHSGRPGGHDRDWQAIALLHLTSHAQDVTQSIVGQDDGPVQSTEHWPNPQLTEPHAIAPVQVMSQLAPCAQSMVPQALALLHRIVQSNPSGHCTLPHGLPVLQLISHVMLLRSHDVHGLGQSSVRSTQYPRSQVRVLSAQSPSVVHANSLECRLTEQVDSVPSPTRAMATTTATGFITDLPGS